MRCVIFLFCVLFGICGAEASTWQEHVMRGDDTAVPEYKACVEGYDSSLYMDLHRHEQDGFWFGSVFKTPMPLERKMPPRMVFLSGLGRWFCAPKSGDAEHNVNAQKTVTTTYIQQEYINSKGEGFSLNCAIPHPPNYQDIAHSMQCMFSQTSTSTVLPEKELPTESF